MEGIKKAGSLVGARKQINFIEGTGTEITVTDATDGKNQIDVEIASTGSYVAEDAGARGHKVSPTVTKWNGGTPVSPSFLDTDGEYYFAAVDGVYDPNGWLGTAPYVSDSYWGGITFPAKTYYDLPPGLYFFYIEADLTANVPAGKLIYGQLDYVDNAAPNTYEGFGLGFLSQVGGAGFPNSLQTSGDFVYSTNLVSLTRQKKVTPYLYVDTGASGASLGVSVMRHYVYKVA